MFYIISIFAVCRFYLQMDWQDPDLPFPKEHSRPFLRCHSGRLPWELALLSETDYISSSIPVKWPIMWSGVFQACYRCTFLRQPAEVFPSPHHVCSSIHLAPQHAHSGCKKQTHLERIITPYFAHVSYKFKTNIVKIWFHLSEFVIFCSVWSPSRPMNFSASLSCF